MRRRMVDLLRDRRGRREPSRPTDGRVREPARRRGRGGGRLHGQGAGPAVVALVLVAVLALAPACASGGPKGGGADADGDRTEAAAEAGGEEDAADESRRAASDRMVDEGRAALEAGRLDEAASRLERAVRVDPSNGRAYLALAEVRIAEGRPGAAEGLVERALTLLDPGSPPAARADSLRAELEAGPD